MNVIDKLKDAVLVLKNKGIENPAKEAEILITEALCIDKSRLYSGGLEISEEMSGHIDSLIERRAQGEPIQYIVGHVNFYGLKINVGRGVLIPRPETELLVEETIKIFLSRITHYASRITILDLCTGSGCIALALARHFTDAEVYGVDKSDIAIKYAVRNAKENNVKNVHFIKGDIFEPVRGMMFDCIVSNPPYIKRMDIQTLQREIKEYEPTEALDGGEDGLDFYRRIFKDAPEYIKEKGVIILEIGFEQADDVLLIANKAGFSKVNFIKDYSGIERICIASR